MTCDPVGVPYTTNYEYPKFSVNDLNVSSFNLPQSTKMPLNEVHMIYTVECSFTDPTAEDGWNVFYSDEKLPALISVRGFLTSQRFKLSEGHTFCANLHGVCIYVPMGRQLQSHSI